MYVCHMGKRFPRAAVPCGTGKNYLYDYIKVLLDVHKSHANIPVKCESKNELAVHKNTKNVSNNMQKYEKREILRIIKSLA